MKQVYLPVMPAGGIPKNGVIGTTEKEKGYRPIHWMDPEVMGTEAYWPYVLLSFYYFNNQVTDFPADQWIFGDSGGFTVATQGARIDPSDVIRWQIRSTNVGVILDIPPHNILDEQNGGFAAANWIKALSHTARNVKIAAPIYRQALKEGTSFRWWGVLQGESREQLNDWYNKITEAYPFDLPGEGWAIKCWPTNNTPQIARLLRFVQSKKIDHAHFLQSTGLPTVTTLFCLAPQTGLEFMTYDSSSDAARAINRTVLVPTSDWMDFTEITEKKSKGGGTGARDYMRDVCQCLSCRYLREDLEQHDHLRDLPEEVHGDYYFRRMAFHNTICSLRIVQTLWDESLRDPEKVLLDMLGAERFSQTMRAFEGREPHFVSLGTPKSLLDFLE